MKLRITFKDPDGVYECVRDAVQESLPDGLTDGELGDLLKTRTRATSEKLQKWLEFNEYVTVEFDTEAGTAVVVPATA